MSNYTYDSYANRRDHNDRPPTDNISQDLRELYEDDLRFRSEQQSQVLPVATGLPQPVQVRRAMNYQGNFQINQLLLFVVTKNQ